MRKQKFEIKKIGHSTISFNGEVIARSKTGLSSCRDIFKAKEYVIKIDNPSVEDNTGYQCRREYNNWRKIRKSDKSKYFVPILKFGRIDGRAYVIQPRIEISKKNSPLWAWNIIDEIQNEFDLDDLHHGNWTVQEDSVLIFDYAF
jgi:hypothetical protein